MTTVLVGLLAAALGALACWLIVRARSTAPDTPAARAEIQTVTAEAKAAAETKAAEVTHAPVSDIDARVEQLRERGRAGK